MAGSNQNSDRSRTRRDSAESPKSLSKTAGGETKESLKKRDEDWGNETEKGGMAVEAKMGMGIVVILLCAFAFLVYHKFDLKQRALLQANISKKAGPSSAADVSVGAATLEVRDANGERRIGAESQAIADAAAPAKLATLQEDAPLFDLSEPDAPAFDVAASERPTVATEDELIPSPQPTEDPFAALAAANQAREQAVTETIPAEVPPTSAKVVPTQPLRSEPLLAANASAPDRADPFADAVATPAPQPPAPLFPSFNAEVAQPPADESQVAVADSERNDGPVTAEDVPMSDLFPNFDATHDAPAVLAEPEVAATEMVPRLSELPPAVSVSQSRGLPTVSAPAESPFATPDSETTEPPAFSDAADSATTSLQNSPMIAMAEPQPDVNLFQDHDTTPTPKLEPKPTPFVADQQPYQRPAQVAEPRQFGGEVGFDRDGQTPPLMPAPTANSRTATQPALVIDESNETSDPAFTFAPVPIPADDQSPTLSAAPEPKFGVAQFAYENGIRPVAASSDDCEICVVKHNDNYWTISKRAYGTARYFSSLALFNQHRIKDPKKLRPGMKVLIPDPKRLEAKYPELFREFQEKATQPPGYFLQKNGKPAYRVGERETLSEISQKHLGRASRWMQIYRMNQARMKDPNRLKPGTVLLLPDDATDVNIAP